ncbi:CocE/NonD family hydrolase, partial [bacterium]
YPWFRYHLKGGAPPAIPRAAVFDTGQNRWNEFAAWPPQAQPMALGLGADGGASLDGKAVAGEKSYVSDPANPVRFTAVKGTGTPSAYMAEDQRFLADRTDVVTFRTEPLVNPLTLGGTVEAKLRAIVDGTDADFVVKLIDERPDGTLALVRWDIMRGKFRDSFEKPSPLPKGKPVNVRVPMNDVMHTFLPGHRITVQIQSSIFPLLDRNTHRFEDLYKATAYYPAKISIVCGGREGSRVVLPVLK